MASITYHIVMLVLKLKGIKKTFSKFPVAFEQLRKEDIHIPNKRHLAGQHASQFKIGNSTITEITPTGVKASDFLILYCPGGAFVYGPTELNWSSIATIVKATHVKAWVIDYPKAPDADIQEMNRNMDTVYEEALKSYSPSNIILIGDSVGGTLMMTLLQRLIKQVKKIPVRLVAISPVLDASMSHPEIYRTDPLDPILSKTGVLSAKKLCAGSTDLRDPAISPLYGSFKGFPATHLFIAENDIMMPDEKLAVTKMLEEQVSLEVIDGKGIPHIWPLLPIMTEAKAALSKIEAIIKETIAVEKEKAQAMA